MSSEVLLRTIATAGSSVSSTTPHWTMLGRLVHPGARLPPRVAAVRNSSTNLLQPDDLQGPGDERFAPACNKALRARAAFEAKRYIDSLSDTEVFNLADQSSADVQLSDINMDCEAFWYLRGVLQWDKASARPDGAGPPFLPATRPDGSTFSPPKKALELRPDLYTALVFPGDACGWRTTGSSPRPWRARSRTRSGKANRATLPRR